VEGRRSPAAIRDQRDGREKRRLELRPGLPPRQAVRYLHWAGRTAPRRPAPLLAAPGHLGGPLNGPRPAAFPPRSLVRTHRFPASVLALILLGGCGEIEPPEAGEPAGAGGETSAAPIPAPGPEQVFDREVLFVSMGADSTVHVPWFFRNRSTPGTIRREQEAWLSRDGSWEVLSQETTEGPAARVPWRILPGEKIRLLVGEDDRLEALVFRDPPREVETRFGEFVTGWSRLGGESVLLYRGRTEFPSGPVDGFVLDLNRRWQSPEGTPGDWFFLHSGEDLQFFMEELVPIQEPRDLALHRAWSRIGPEDAEWLSISMDWDELRPFERARRDIPARWTFSSPGGEVFGELLAVDSHLTVGDGEGPILPVSGFFGVTGTLRIQGEEFPVVGTVRHVQP
jgi:hypothetical protein